MNLRIVSMPRWKIISWPNHMMRKLIQPSVSRPVKLPLASAAAEGMKSRMIVATALEAK